jgi:uncharacterized protein YcbK (DUF882 family)
MTDTMTTTPDWSKFPNFHREEFDSPDEPFSGHHMKVEFLERLQRAREAAGRPFVITSGFRTQEHNKKIYERLGKKPIDSPHLYGWAADIACASSSLRQAIITALVQEGFTRIGIGKTFIHVDARPDAPQKVFWLY